MTYLIGVVVGAALALVIRHAWRQLTTLDPPPGQPGHLPDGGRWDDE